MTKNCLAFFLTSDLEFVNAIKIVRFRIFHLPKYLDCKHHLLLFCFVNQMMATELTTQTSQSPN